MNCKYCDAPLEEGAAFCPVCGKALTEEPEAAEDLVVDTSENTADLGCEVEQNITEEPEIEANVEEKEEATQAEPKLPMAWWKAALMGAGVMLVLIVFVFAILRSQGIDPADWFAPKEPAAQQGSTDETGDDTSSESVYPLNRDSYTAAEEDPAAQAALVVAKCGDMELTNAQLQIYYWSGVYEFINSYQSYLTSMGLDLSKPLDQQEAMDGTTWQQFFLENAIFNWHKFSALAQEAEKNGHVLSDGSQQTLDGLPAQMEELAAQGGYASAEEMLAKEMGALVSMESYLDYSRDYYMAMEYFNAEYDKLQPTEQQLEDYFTQHEEELAASGITKDSKTYDVRHILLEPEGGTEDANGLMTYTEEQWAACLKEAQAMLDQWKAQDGTEEGFATLAKNHSVDGGSSTNGGLYSGLDASTNFVEEFKNWYLDESRQVGDTGIVQSVYGYHIMYLSAAGNNWQSYCQSALVTELSETFVQDTMETYKVEIYDDKIAIGSVTFQTQ